MNIAEYAAKELKIKLNYFQLDALELLQRDPDAWKPKLKPKTHDMRIVFRVYEKWLEHQNSPVAC